MLRGKTAMVGAEVRRPGKEGRVRQDPGEKAASWESGSAQLVLSLAPCRSSDCRVHLFPASMKRPSRLGARVKENEDLAPLALALHLWPQISFRRQGSVTV